MISAASESGQFAVHAGQGMAAVARMAPGNASPVFVFKVSICDTA